MRTLFVILVAAAMGLAGLPARAEQMVVVNTVTAGVPANEKASAENSLVNGARLIVTARLDQGKLCKEPIIKTDLECLVEFNEFISAEIEFTSKNLNYLLALQKGDQNTARGMKADMEASRMLAARRWEVIHSYQPKKTSRLETGDGK